MPKKKVIISACLLGESCRYDGKTKKINGILEAFREYEIIPFCPEAPLFGTPRERISVVEVKGEKRIITDFTNKDVTQILANEINAFIRKNPQVENIVLKSKSPSCGLHSTSIRNFITGTYEIGNGIAAEIFLQKYSGVKIQDESEFT